MASFAASEPKVICVSFTDNNVPVRPTRAPGAMAVTSATASICAGSPYAREPLGPTQIATGTFDAAMDSKSSAIRSRPITAPFEFN